MQVNARQAPSSAGARAGSAEGQQAQQGQQAEGSGVQLAIEVFVRYQDPKHGFSVHTFDSHRTGKCQHPCQAPCCGGSTGAAASPGGTQLEAKRQLCAWLHVPPKPVAFAYTYRQVHSLHAYLSTCIPL